MVSAAQLAAFDGLLWVGNGQQAGMMSSLSQPTISRAAHHVANSLGLSLQKVRGEWHVTGHTQQLELERIRHQTDRLNTGVSLRLEAGAISSRVLAEAPLTPWILGRADAINQPRSLDLLKQRVIDAWICTSAQDLPEDPRHEMCVRALFRAPLRLVASSTHALTKERGLRTADLSEFPSVALDGDWFPRSAAVLESHGLWRDPRRLNHYKSRHWEGRTADGQTLAYASPVMLERDPSLCPLDFDLGLEQQVALVVMNDLAHHPAILALQEELLKRVQLLEPKQTAKLRVP